MPETPKIDPMRWRKSPVAMGRLYDIVDPEDTVNCAVCRWLSEEEANLILHRCQAHDQLLAAATAALSELQRLGRNMPLEFALVKAIVGAEMQIPGAGPVGG